MDNPRNNKQGDPKAVNTVLADMIDIWQELFRHADIREDSDFFDLGGHSLTAGYMQIVVSRRIGLTLRTTDILRYPILRDLVEYVESQQVQVSRAVFLKSSDNVIPLQPEGVGTPIFVISEGFIFRPLAMALGKSQPVYSIQSELEYASFQDWVTFYAGIIRKVQPSGPYRLAGWCVSGWIGYGVARLLENQGEQIELLAVVDGVAPGYWDIPVWQKGKRKLVYLRHRFQRSKSTPWQMLGRVFQKKEVDPGKIAADRMDKLCEVAKYCGRFHGKLLLFAGDEEPDLLQRSGLGWDKMIGSPVAAIHLPGDHYEIFAQPGAQIMADRILSELKPRGE